MWEARVGVQVSRKEFHTHIHLDYDKVDFLSCIKKKKLTLLLTKKKKINKHPKGIDSPKKKKDVKIFLRENKRQLMAEGSLNSAPTTYILLYHHQQSNDGTSIQGRINNDPSEGLGCNPSSYI